MSYLIYAFPIYFALALLAMNAAGIIVVTEWVYTAIPGEIREGFDTPGLRCGKALVAMTIALLIAILFQTLLRVPARKKLRLQLAQVTGQLASYNILFQAMMNEVVPVGGRAADETQSESKVGGRAAEETQSESKVLAIASIRIELIARESHIQGAILDLYPLMKFAAIEPAFGQVFQAKTMGNLIAKHQLLLGAFSPTPQTFAVSNLSN
jgi:hypothetical protein